jgi:3-phenylpropionate/trans-cinnamate dioxygenase ferredoxin reductase subunit
MNVNIWDVTGPIKTMIQSGQRVDADSLADPGISLSDLATR